MQIYYTSTRGDTEKRTASEAILRGLADDGGLFMPDHIPKLDVDLADLCKMTYQEVAYAVLKLFLTDFTEEELKSCIASAYDDKFDTPEIAPIFHGDHAYYLELFHGPTVAFKDMALSILPYLLTTAARKKHVKREIVILTATSGDTGKAALAGFADVPGTKIIVFYPKNGVSPIQERQMATQRGKNICIVAIKGNFDDAQRGVKTILHNEELRNRMFASNYQFSSANSINIGRLFPQVVYYVYAYAGMINRGKVKPGDPINVVVPTGNFGNILAAYYAKQIGIPIRKLLCASNINKVLYDFFTTGTYDRNRPFMVTSSPSMDILVSSNLERLIYQVSGCDAKACNAFMQDLIQKGHYTITPQMREGLSDFYAGYATENQTMKTIKRVFENAHYIIDTHTAVASHVYYEYRKKTGDTTKTVVAATASPYKFVRSVMTAIEPGVSFMKDLELLDALSQVSRVPVPKVIDDLRYAPVRNIRVCPSDQMQRCVEEYLL